MTKKIFVSLLLIALVSISTLSCMPSRQDDTSASDQGDVELTVPKEAALPTPTATLQGPGIYYEAIDSDVVCDVYDGFSCSVCSFLHYDGRIYTGAFLEGPIENAQELTDGQRLATVYANHGSFSTDKNELAECTSEGSIYTVEGYAEKDMVCATYTAAMPSGGIDLYREYFICLNGIQVEKGADLFRDRIPLAQIEEINWKPAQTDSPYTKLRKKEVSQLKKAINKANFLQTKRTSMESERGRMVHPTAGELKFCDEKGIEYVLYVNKKQLVSYSSPEGTEFVLDIGTEWQPPKNAK